MRLVQVLVLGAAMMQAASAFAQTAPGPGSPVAPPSRSQIDRLPVPAPPRSSRLTVSGGIERAPCPLQEPRFANVEVKLDRVVFDDLEAVSADDLAPAYAGYVGKSVPIAAVCDMRDAAATILRSRGYLAAVQVPPQQISGGTLHLKVLMAHLVAVHVLGDAGRAERLLGAYLERLKRPGPFNQIEAERALLLAGDLPGFDVHLTLRSAGATPGAVVGDVAVTRIPFTVDANVQNFGSRAVGPWSGLVNAQFNDLLGLGDRLVVGAFNTADWREQHVVQAAYELRPFTDGLSVAGRFTYAWTRPGIGGGDPVRATTLLATAEASYPLIRRQAETVRLAGGLDVVDQRLTFGGLPFTEDRLRVLYARADLDLIDPAGIVGIGGASAVDPRWRISGSLEFRRGLAALGASGGCGAGPLYASCVGTPTLSRADGDPQASVLRFVGSLQIKPTHNLTLIVSPRAQIASAPLLSFEQFSAGNYTVGRGYDPGALSGDNGYGVQLEGRFGPIAIPHLAGGVVQPFVFTDMASVRTLGPIRGVYDRNSLISVGGGARVAFRDRAALEVMLAAPVGGPPIAGRPNDVRLLVNLTYDFEGPRQ